MLKLSKKKVEYWYVRTWKELKVDIFERFCDSGLGDLPLSCHGSRTQISLTLDDVEFKEFGQVIGPYLAKRRLFVSACEVVNASFVDAANSTKECYSVINLDEEISYDDAAVMWVSFYRLIPRDPKEMEMQEITKVLAKLQEIRRDLPLFLM